jgi:disulfide bond formation protein DsbB
VAARGGPVAIDAVLNGAAVAAIGAALLAAYALQFALGEQPCPLCTLQRVAMVLALVGFVLNLRFGAQPLHYAVVLLAAGFGMVVAGRQVMLHVVPGSGEYGSALLGLHLYTWSFLTFAAMVPGVALLLALYRPREAQREAGAPVRRSWALALCWLAAGLALANAVTIFLQCGPIECSDDPSGWWALGTNR